jgi:hypothetical protein
MPCDGSRSLGSSQDRCGLIIDDSPLSSVASDSISQKTCTEPHDDGAESVTTVNSGGCGLTVDSRYLIL